VAAAAASAAIVTGLSGGNLSQMLRAGVIAGATAFAFYEVGDLTLGPAHASPAFDSPSFNAANYAENVAGHALVGCGAAVANGSSCGSGALSGAVTASAGPLINGQSYGAALAENAVLGGAASVAGGGKFANGAITGAFGYLFNACGGPNGCAFLGAAGGAAFGVVFAGGCDLGTFGWCAVANPAIVASGTVGGGAFGAAIDRAWGQLDTLIRNATSTGPGAYQYALIANSDGPYPDVRNGTAYLNAGDVWKYGTTVDPSNRYSASYLSTLGVSMQIQATETTSQVLVQEKLMLMQYAVSNGSLPPGNKIFK
jgi:hypothetical protein